MFSVGDYNQFGMSSWQGIVFYSLFEVGIMGDFYYYMRLVEQLLQLLLKDKDSLERLNNLCEVIQLLNGKVGLGFFDFTFGIVFIKLGCFLVVFI